MKPSDFLTELSNEKLAQYKTAAAADASKADKEGDYKKGDKRFSGIVKATKKQFANDAKKVEETQDFKGTLITETRTYKLWENAGRKLMEAEMTADQIQQIFQKVQDIETAGGTNRSIIGKTKDALGTVGDAWEELKGKAQNSGPIKNMDAYYDQAAEKLKQATGGDQGVMQYVQKYRDFAKKHPVAQSLIYAALIAAAGVSGVGAGGAAALGLFKMVDKLLQGEKFSSAAYAGAKSGSMAYGAGQIGQHFKGGDAVAGNSGPHPRGDVAGPSVTTTPDAGVAHQAANHTSTAGNAAEHYTKIGGQRFIPGEPLTRTQMAAVDMSRSMGNPVSPAVQQAYDMAVKAGVGAAKPLSESQIYRLIGTIVKHQKRIDEGLMDTLKGVTDKAGKWFDTKAKNLTNKITADKLLQAWKKAGSPTDSDQVADIMTKAGVPSETLNNVYANFKLPPPKAVTPVTGTLNTGNAANSNVNTNATSTSNTSRPFTGAINPYAQAGQPSVGIPASTSSSNRMSTRTNPTAAPAPAAGIPSFRTVNDAKDAIDDVLDGLKTLKRRNRAAAINYGASEFGKLAQQSQQAIASANANQPKPANLRVSGGNPGAPTPAEQANFERRIQQASGQTNESVGLPYPNTYEETNDMFKSSGQRRIGTLTTEDEQIDGMAQGEIRAIIKNAIHIKNQLDKGVSLDGWMYSYVTTSNDHLNSVAEQINNPNIDEQELDEACWKGYHKEGNKKMFGKTYPNCVKNEGVAEEQLNELDMWAPVTTFIKMTDGSYVQAEWRRSQGNPGFNDSASFIKFKPVNSTVVKQLGLDSHQKNTSISNPRTGTIATGGDYQGSGPLANRRYDVVDYNKPETMAELPPEIKSELVKWVQTQGVAESHHSESCPHCGGEMVSEELMNEKKDACYYKVKSRYKVWPSAYASGALVKCRKKGASNWGTGGKSNEGVAEGSLNEFSTGGRDDDDGDDRGPGLTRQEFKNALKLALGYDMAGVDVSTFEGGMLRIEVNGERRIVPCNKLGVKDAAAFVKRIKNRGVAEDQLDEKWSKKYKDSINCSNPKGFSQKAHCAGKKKNESSILEGLEQVDENLHQWFKEKWVRFGPDGKIRGACARGSDSEGKPKCLPQSKAHNLGKKGRASAAARKRREDPNPERSGKAINVNTKKK